MKICGWHAELLAHHILCSRKNILHWDISSSNIMLYHPCNTPSSSSSQLLLPTVPGSESLLPGWGRILHHGFLTDYDYASKLVPMDKAQVITDKGNIVLAQRQCTIHICSFYFFGITTNSLNRELLNITQCSKSFGIHMIASMMRVLHILAHHLECLWSRELPQTNIRSQILLSILHIQPVLRSLNLVLWV